MKLVTLWYLSLFFMINSFLHSPLYAQNVLKQIARNPFLPPEQPLVCSLQKQNLQLIGTLGSQNQWHSVVILNDRLSLPLKMGDYIQDSPLLVSQISLDAITLHPDLSTKTVCPIFSSITLSF